MDSDSSLTCPTSSTAEFADIVFEVGSQLRLELDGPVDAPVLSSLFELRSLCERGKRDSEFWRVIAVAAARDLCGPLQPEPGFAGVDLVDFSIGALMARRYRDWEGLEFEDAEAAICGEINLFIQRFLNGGEMATKTKPAAKPETTKPKRERKGETMSRSLRSLMKRADELIAIAGLNGGNTLQVEVRPAVRAKLNPGC